MSLSRSHRQYFKKSGAIHARDGEVKDVQARRKSSRHLTGGNSGIGLATAQRLANEGAYVFITGRQGELDAAAKQIGKNVTAVQGDVSNLADLDRLYATIKQQKGRIDILFANAGGGALAPLGAIIEAHYDKTFNAKVKGLLFTVQKALPLFTNGGSIILNASIVSIKGDPGFSVYIATKAVVRCFARNWTLDLKDRKIRVNAVSPERALYSLCPLRPPCPLCKTPSLNFRLHSHPASSRP